MDTPILILSRKDVAGLMRPADYLAAVEAGFRAAAEGRAASPAPMQVLVEHGGFHAKAALFNNESRAFVALKLNANFPGNSERLGLPTIQGVIVLSDAETGVPLAMMDSIEVTVRRTAAASALAARFLARDDAKSIGICGCGAQGRAHLEALVDVLPLAHGAVWDLDHRKAQALAQYGQDTLGLDLRPAAAHREATLEADVIVTCTTARSPFLAATDVRPGAFIAAVGADAPYKSEIDPRLMSAASVFADVLEQCVVMGDLKHALAAGVMTAEDVRGDLAGLTAGRRPGRTRAEEVIVFDSTGTGLQDAASAALLYERARDRGVGVAVDMA
jgi:ornithine cyclodeaminase/alanine dehydrogenase-like protein (mu-crystallin family)